MNELLTEFITKTDYIENSHFPDFFETAKQFCNNNIIYHEDYFHFNF